MSGRRSYLPYPAEVPGSDGSGGGGSSGVDLVDVNGLAAFSYGVNAKYAAVRNVPALGTTLSLTPAPANGEQYTFSTDASASPTAPVVVAGTGGKLVNGLASVAWTSPFSYGTITYDAVLGQWVLQVTQQGYVSVQSFGAVADGVTDDAAAIQRAFNAVANTGIVLTWPKANYVLSSAVTVPASVAAAILVPPGTTFSGAGAASVANLAIVIGAAPGTAAYCPGFYALTTIGLDPAAGLDTNAGTLASPLKTLSEVVRRWGGANPHYPTGSSVALQLVDGQPAGVDALALQPDMAGGSFAVVGTPAIVQAAFVSGVITAANVAIGGLPMTIAGVPAGVVAGVLLQNTRTLGWAFVDSVVAGTAHVQNPMTNASATTIGVGAGAADAAWVTGDTLVGYSLPNWNASLDPTGGSDVAGATSVGWTQQVTLVDPSGAGASVYRHTCRAACNTLSLCKVNARLDTSAFSGRGSALAIIGCTMLGGGNAHFTGNSVVYGSGYSGGMIVEGAGWEQTLGTIVHGTFTIEATDAQLNGFFSDGNIRVVAGGFAQWTSACWGTFLTNLQQASCLTNNSGTTWVLGWLTAGAMTIGTAGTASRYIGLGVNADGVAITQAAIDAGGGFGPGMFDVLTGSRYCNVN
jgi:pectate lyase-like protein